MIGTYSIGYQNLLEKTREFARGLKGEPVKPTYTLDDFIGSLEKPRVILVMVTVGGTVDQVLDLLYLNLEKGDIVMDGGNSYFKDTDRRSDLAKERGIEYLSLGISGGEEGARKGACIMAGGSKDGYEFASPILRLVAAKLPEGEALAYWGPKSSGHFTKIVHNGIEYAIMQAMAEAYDILANLGRYLKETR